MWRFLYSLLLTVSLPLIVLRLLLKSVVSPAYRARIGERFSFFAAPEFDATKKTVIWLHAVSVGETMAAAPLLKSLQAKHSDLRFAVTTTTPTGSDRVRSLFGQTVFHVYAPYDLDFVLRRFLKRIKPDLLILMETEMWPNTIAACKRQGIKIMLANARLSEKSALGYSRAATLSSQMLSAIDAISAQSQQDAERLFALGAELSAVEVTGSLKFHMETDPQFINPKRQVEPFLSVQQSGRQVIVFASTREGEEAIILRAVRGLLAHPDAPLCILIPRHPERFDQVAALARQQGLAIQRRSSSEAILQETQVLLGDSMGEMMDYYRLSHIAFVGGSLVNTGCQNVLEPSACSLPVLVGPSQFNFASICRQLEAAEALLTVNNAAELTVQLRLLLDDSGRRKRMGEAGKELILANRTALPRVEAKIEELLGLAG
ncbi:MAG: 3-deoxy-D-manno-octulosonic acid transferase [Gammaproteobacteria bacterium]|nr:3-deoxy-D-manno-octulosonic acid transferase [Gammaproteobacteria bacterium]|tara:strand:+ start:1292 stop:2587 length:1296 start_codon:yes stop_codon:yes gene_type:complete